MKTSELRLKNIVNDKLNGEGKIKRIYSDVVFLDYPHKRFDFYVQKDICEIEPVPLTEEWMLKFNAKPVTSVKYKLNGLTFNFNSMGKLRYVFNKKVLYIDYVHQLQNLYFALTGEELEIKT